MRPARVPHSDHSPEARSPHLSSLFHFQPQFVFYLAGSFEFLDAFITSLPCSRAEGSEVQTRTPSDQKSPSVSSNFGSLFPSVPHTTTNQPHPTPFLQQNKAELCGSRHLPALGASEMAPAGCSCLAWPGRPVQPYIHQPQSFCHRPHAFAALTLLTFLPWCLDTFLPSLLA